MSERIPGFSYTTWYAIYAPAAMPNILVEQISAALRKVLTDPAVEQKLEPHGVEHLAGGPHEVCSLVKRDTEKCTAVANIIGNPHQSGGCASSHSAI
jgi:tripartite-type tricarboxylate transporter receptor subunit TctC